MEKIIKNKLGRVKLRITTGGRCGNRKTSYTLHVSRCDLGKRKFIDIFDYNGYKYRALSLDDRERLRAKLTLEYVSSEDIESFLIEYHDSRKPSIENLYFN